MRQIINAGRHVFDLSAKKMTKAARGDMSSKTHLVCLMFWTALFFGNGAAVAAELSPSRQTAFLYDVDVDFMYLTEAKGLSVKQGAKVGGPAKYSVLADSSQGMSTFGLYKAGFNFEWRLPRGIAFQTSIRPDAVQETDGSAVKPVRELDTRSGRVVEEMPRVHFLDEYRLIVKRQSVEGRVGVERAIMESFRVTPEILGFGLRVRGPEKSFSAGIYAPEVFNIGGDKSDEVIGLSFGVLSGRDERHDGRTGETAEVGESSSKRDPYWGASVNMGANLAGGTRAALNAAMIEERQQGAKVRQEWYGLGVRRSLEGSVGPRVDVAIEARQLRESFRMEGTEISDVRLMSVGVTSLINRTANEAALLGLWIGSGDLHPDGVLSRSLSAKGLQAEAGWRWLVEDQLEFVTMVSREWRRDGSESGGTVGGFKNGSSSRSAQSRFAIQMRYYIGGQI